jgi:hypothetical protein
MPTYDKLPEPRLLERRFADERWLRELRMNDKKVLFVTDEIDRECTELAVMLKAKNAAYGNSALDPVRIFSKASPVEQILVRLDDKLSRLQRGSAAGEDVILDLLGYLVLLRIAMRRGE